MLNDKRAIHSIINVNYAGEFGAVHLYTAQLFLVTVLYPDLVDMIRVIRSDEKSHRQLFLELMPKYGMRPCRLTWLWAAAGITLGVVTPLLGRRGMLMGIKAAEDTAHEHLGDQVKFLALKDVELAEIISRVQAEEQKHVMISEENLGTVGSSLYERLVYQIVYLLCQSTMWVVTKGESAKLKRML